MKWCTSWGAMLIWIHGFQPLPVSGSLCIDLGRLWTSVGGEDWLCHQNDEQAAPPLLLLRAQLTQAFSSGSCSFPGSKQVSHVHLCIPMQSLPGKECFVNNRPLPEQCFPRALSLTVSAGEAFPPNKLFCISWQMALLKELWICVGLFLFAASAAWSILREVNWPLSSPGHWQDDIHNECTSSSQCSSMSGLTSDPFSTNSARHRRYLTPFPRGEQTPAVYQIGYKISWPS